MKKWVLGMAVLVLFLLPFSAFAADTVYEQVYGQPEMDGTVYEEEDQNNNEAVQSSGDVFHSGSPTNSNTFTISARNVPADTVKVMLKVWTTKGGQDDVKWYEMENSDGIYSYTVNSSSHKLESGEYNAEVYLQDTAGAQTLFDSTQVYINKMTAQNYIVPAGFVTDSFTARVEGVAHEGGNDQIKRVLFATWTDEGGQDDIKWYWGVKVDEGVWEYTVQVSPNHHDRYGNYNVHMYGEDKSGNRTFLKSFVVTREQMTVTHSVMVTPNSTEMNINMQITGTNQQKVVGVHADVQNIQAQNQQVKTYDTDFDGTSYHITADIDDFAELTNTYSVKLYLDFQDGSQEMVKQFIVDMTQSVANAAFQYESLTVDAPIEHSNFYILVSGVERINGTPVQSVKMKYKYQGSTVYYAESLSSTLENGVWKLEGQTHDFDFRRGEYEYILYATGERGVEREFARGTTMVEGIMGWISINYYPDEKGPEWDIYVDDIYATPGIDLPELKKVVVAVGDGEYYTEYEYSETDATHWWWLFKIQKSNLYFVDKGDKYKVHAYAYFDGMPNRIFLGQTFITQYENQNWYMTAYNKSAEAFSAVLSQKNTNDEYERIFFRVKNPENGQWAEMTPNVSGSFTKTYQATIDKSDFGNAVGDYYVYAYGINSQTGQEEFIKSCKYQIKWMSADSITPNKTYMKTLDFNVTVTGISNQLGNSTTSIYAKVFSPKGFRGNFAGDVTNGVIPIQISYDYEHAGHTGTYRIEVYARDAHGTNYLGQTTVELCSVNATVEYDSYTVNGMNYEDIYIYDLLYKDGSETGSPMWRMKYADFADNNPEYYVDVEPMGNHSWVGHAVPSNVNYFPGNYLITAGVVLDEGIYNYYETNVVQRWYYIPRIAEQANIDVQTDGQLVTFIISNVASTAHHLTNERIPIQSVYLINESYIGEEFQNDKWFPCTNLGNGTWSFTLDRNQIKGYRYYVVAENANGTKNQIAVTTNVPQPLQPSYRISDDSQSISITLTAGASVQFEVFTNETDKKILNTTQYNSYLWQSTIFTSDFTPGAYRYFITPLVTKEDGSVVRYNTQIVDIYPKSDFDAKNITLNFEDYYRNFQYIAVSNASNLNYIMVYGKKSGKGTAKKVDVHRGEVSIMPSQFGHNTGDIVLDFYGQDVNGNDYYAGTKEIYVKELTCDQIRIDKVRFQEGDTSFTVYADNVNIPNPNGSAYVSVAFAVWSDYNGQDDIKWYGPDNVNYDTGGGSNYYKTVSLANHNNDKGIYYIDVYGDYGEPGEKIRTYFGRFIYYAGRIEMGDFSFVIDETDIFGFEIKTSVPQSFVGSGGTVKYKVYPKLKPENNEEYVYTNGNVYVPLSDFQFKFNNLVVEGVMIDITGKEYKMKTGIFNMVGDSYYFDDRNRLICIDRKNGMTTDFNYDDNGNLTLTYTFSRWGEM